MWHKSYRARREIRKLKAENSDLKLSSPVEPEVKPACELCRSYEMTSEEHLKNFCSQWCIRLDKLYSWDTKIHSCSKFVSKSV